MRFGIMSMQIDALIPTGLPLPGIMEHIASFDHANLVGRLVDQGFNLIELNGDLVMFLPQTYAPAAVERLAALKAQRGLAYTMHLPLWSVEPSTLLNPVREGSVRALIEAIQTTRPLVPEAYVLHGTGALAAEFYRMRIPETARGLLLRQFQAAARQSIRTILSETGIDSRLLAIETVEFPHALTLELAEEFDLSVCFDPGHILAGFSGEVDFFEALESVLPRLGEVHLHDCPRWLPGQAPRYGLDHQPLGKGDLDVARFLDRLDRAGFTGPIVFELQVEEARASLDVIRSLRPEYIDL